MKHITHQKTAMEVGLHGRRNLRIWLASLLVSLAMGVAYATEPDSGAWRAELIRQQGMTPVKGVRVTSAEKKAVWQAFRKQFGDMRVQMGRTTCVATNVTRRCVFQRFVRGDGVSGVVAMLLRAEDCRIASLMLSRLDVRDAGEFVRTNLVGCGSSKSAVWGCRASLGEDAVISLSPSAAGGLWPLM